MILQAWPRRGRRVLVFALFLVLLALPATVAGAQVPPAPGGQEVVALAGGAGGVTLGDRFPERFRGDRVLVAFAATARPDGTVQGGFTITHREPDGSLFARLSGEVTCVRIEGDHAVVTGIIRRADTPGLPDGEVREGMTAGIVVQDGGPAADRIAWSFGATDQTCVDIPAVTAAQVERGDFIVRGR